jgi:hypothetical protein
MWIERVATAFRAGRSVDMTQLLTEVLAMPVKTPAKAAFWI